MTSFAPQFLVDDLERSIAYYQKIGFTFGEPWEGFYAIGVLDGLELHLTSDSRTIQLERVLTSPIIGLFRDLKIPPGIKRFGNEFATVVPLKVRLSCSAFPRVTMLYVRSVEETKRVGC